MSAVAVRRRHTVLLSLMLVTVWSTPGAAHAETATPMVGWWWAGRPSGTFPLLLSPVPPVPEGGFYIAGDLSGPSGLSALRFELEEEETAVTLTLRVAESIGTPVVDACPSAAAWEPVQGGPWETRPTPDCTTTSTTGVVSDDGTTLTFDLARITDPGPLDLVFVPGAAADGTAAIFSASFEPPAADAVTTATPGPGADSTTPPESEPPALKSGVVPPPPGSLPELAPLPAPAANNATDTPVPSRPAPTTPTAARTDNVDGFAYPAVLGLPLVLLGLGSYLARSLTMPITLRSVGGPHG